MQSRARILGAVALLLSACPAHVTAAQKQGPIALAPETTVAKEKSSSEADTAPDTNAMMKSSEGTRTGLVGRFVNDQREIWTSPARLRFPDAEWLVPLSGITAGLFVTDRDYSKRLSQNPTKISHYKTLSNAGVAALVGGAGGMWVMGHVSHNEHWSETGFLAGEAALNSFVAVESFKYTLRRDRPYQGDGSGPFFQNGGTSFPSEHAAAAWSVAGVIAHEYPGPFTKIMAYGLASLVSVSRVKGHQHFPSDVVVGSVIGNLVAQDIYSRHHDFDLGGGEWRSIGEIVRSHDQSPANQGSPYVPLDSWVYSALDRLMALGVIDSGFAGMRPWTRSECARLLSEAAEQIDEEGTGGGEAGKIYRLLETEFHDEVEGPNGTGSFRARVESVYARVTGISGKPLTDGYHFGQTILNDYGRPYQEGFSFVDGFSGWTTSGRWVGYVRAEYEHAPSAPALSATARQTIASVDSIPVVPPATPFAAVNRMQLLDAYVGMNFENWQVTFGKQSLWWGPGNSGPMMFSDNTEPINMFRINRVSPLQPPGFLKWLGPVRMEFFVGQLDGHHFIDTASGITGSWSQSLNPQPFIDGWKLSFKPTPNFEVGLTYTTIFGGVGIPATPHTFVQSLFDSGGNLPDGSSKSSRENGLDFSYRIPKLRKWLTLYGEGFAHDQIIFFIDPKEKPLPFGYPDRAVWRGGIYVPMFPGIRKLDFRAEGGYTSNPLGPLGGYSQGFYYLANRYLNGYTNNGNLLGSWLGRAGQGLQAWSKYWFNARNSLQFAYRHAKVSSNFIPGGGTVNDASVQADFLAGREFGLSTRVQYEHWNYPMLALQPQTNVSVSMQMTYWPHFQVK
jgi:hypothetical protein